MSGSPAAAVHARISRIAADPASGGPFAVSRQQSAGEPETWRELISYRSDAAQSYFRLRSPVDEGGTPIGAWGGPADPAQAAPLAQAVLAAQGWLQPPPAELPPGAPLVVWTCATPEGALRVEARAGTEAAQSMKPLDAALRTLANTVQAARRGGHLRVEARVDGGRLLAALINEGDQPVLVANPFLPAGSGGALFARVEAAEPVTAVPGETAAGPVFRTVAALQPATDEADWREPHLVLAPGRPRVLAADPAFRPFGGYVRVVYANYRQPADLGGRPVIRGQAFSNVLRGGR